MSTLTGQFISQSYGGLIQLSTNTGIVTGSSTQLQDGFGTNLGLFIRTSTAGSGSLTGSGDFSINGLTVGRGGGDRNTNVAVGVRALEANTSAGSSNTAVGVVALFANSVGDNNTAIGAFALQSNTSGSDNTAVGLQSLYVLTSGSSNTAVGGNTLLSNQTGNNNTAVGFGALVNTKENDNTAVGRNAMANLITGSDNTAIGYNTGLGIVTGSNNTILGANVTGLPSSLSNNIILADGAGNIRLRYDSDWQMNGALRVTGSLVTTQGINVKSGDLDFEGGNINIYSGNINQFAGASSLKNLTATGSLLGTASFATNAANANLLDGLDSTVFATTGSNTFRGNQVISGSVANTVGTLTISSNTASIDLSTGNLFTLTLPNGTNTHISASNIQRGQTTSLQITQGSLGTGTVTFSSAFSFPSGSSYIPFASSSAVDLISFISFDNTKLRAVSQNNFI